MQRNAAARRSRTVAATRAPRVGLGPDTAAPSELGGEAEAVHRVLSELVRLLQFRDRDRICCHDVSVTQCYALEVLAAGGPCTLNELSSRLRLDKSTTSRVLDALVAKGYASRQPHPEDGRAVQAAATAAGRRLYARIDADLLANVEQVLAGVDPQLRRALPALLEQLVRATAPTLRGGSCCAP